MFFSANLFALTLTTLWAIPASVMTAPTTETPNTSSFYDISIYADSTCDILTGGIDGSTATNCTLIPNASSGLYAQPNFVIGTCIIGFYSDSDCLDQSLGFSQPAGEGLCIPGGDSQYYQVSGC